MLHGENWKSSPVFVAFFSISYLMEGFEWKKIYWAFGLSRVIVLFFRFFNSCISQCQTLEKHWRVCGTKCGQTGLNRFRLDWSLENFINKKHGVLRVPGELLTLGSCQPKAPWYLLFLTSFQVHSSPGSPSWCELCNQARIRDKHPLGSSDRAVGRPATVLSAGAKDPLSSSLVQWLVALQVQLPVRAVS